MPTPDGKTIWKAAVTSDNGWSHSFTFLRLSPALNWEAGEERPPPFAGTVMVVADDGSGSDEILDAPSDSPAPNPVSPNVSDVDRLLEMFDAPADKEIPEEIEAVPQTIPDTAITEPEYAPLSADPPQRPSGEHFIAWLRQRIARRVLIINDAKALVHTVADTAYLVSPGIFQRYAQEHPATANHAKQESVADWQWIQKRFEKLSLHCKQENGLNIWHCEVSGPRKTHRLHSYLLKDPQCLFDDVPPNNPHLSVVQAEHGSGKAQAKT